MVQSQLREHYNTTVHPAMMKEFSYGNAMQSPRLVKIVVNTGVKEAVSDNKLLNSVLADMATITGQRPVKTLAKKSIANFKLREGMPIGCKVTLRGDNMYDFALRLIGIALPRVRDFKGVSAKGFDGRGNFTMGITEQGIFPEINLDKVQHVFGMNITFVTTAKTDAEAKQLLKLMGIPFRK